MLEGEDATRRSPAVGPEAGGADNGAPPPRVAAVVMDGCDSKRRARRLCARRRAHARATTKFSPDLQKVGSGLTYHMDSIFAHTHDPIGRAASRRYNKMKGHVL